MNDRLYRVTLILSVFALIGAAGVGAVSAQSISDNGNVSDVPISDVSNVSQTGGDVVIDTAGAPDNFTVEIVPPRNPTGGQVGEEGSGGLGDYSGAAIDSASVTATSGSGTASVDLNAPPSGAALDPSGDATFNITTSGTVEEVRIDSVTTGNINTTGIKPGSGHRLGIRTHNNTEVANFDNSDEFAFTEDFEVTNLDAPLTAPDGAEIDISATVTNNGSATNTQTIFYNTTAGDNAGGQVDQDVGSTTVTLDPDESTEFSTTVDTSTLDGANSNAAVNYTHGVFSDGDNQTANLTVGTDSNGRFTVDVIAGDTLEGIEGTVVSLYDGDEFDTKSSPGTPVIQNETTNQDGRVQFSGLAVGENENNPQTYVAVARDEEFESGTTDTNLFETRSTEGDGTITLERLVNADDIEIDKTPADGSVDLGGTITDNVTVSTQDSPENGLGNNAPLSNTPVNVTVVDSTTGEFGAAISQDDLVINPVPPANTGSNGTVEFQISLNQSGINAEAIDGGVDFTLEFEATASGDGPAVTQQQNITFVGEPPTGDGTIAGDVEEIVTDGASNTESADGVSVHAVNTDRVDSNTHGFNTSGGPATVETWVTADEERTTPESVPGEGNDYGEYFRVAELNTDGTVAEILDVRTDYLVSPSTNAYSQNLSMPGTGFTSDSTSDVGVAPLEPGDYQIQYSTDGSFDSPDLSNFTATANLTYEFTEQRYNGSAAVHTDVTRDDGTYELYNLFTNADADTNSDAGQTYVTIAADDTTALGFANFRGYDTVDVQQNSDAGGTFDDTGQLETDLSVFEVPVQPDSVNVTNIGTVSSPADADANFSQDLSAFDDTSDDTRQTIPRDGSTVDVIELRTFAEEGDASVGADATVSFSETDVPETFAGSFLVDGVGGDVSVNSDDQITVDTSPEEGSYEAGEAVIFLRSDSAGLDDDANLTVEADLPGLDTDTTDKLFEGVLSQKYESASITGVVTDDNDNPVDARIFVSEFVDQGAGIEITFVPDDVEDLNNFTATVSQIGGPTLETVDLTAEDMQEFEFQGFGSNLSLAAGEEPYQLLADRAADRTTLSPVPAVPDAQLGPTEDVTYALRGVSAQGQTGTSVSTAVEVNRTSTASVVIDAIETEYQLSNLNPTDATIQQGDDLTVTAEVTNSGDFADNQSVTLEVENEAGDVTEIASQSVELSADASTTVTFTAENVDLAPGNYTHAVASEDSSVEGNLTVEEAPDEANFEVSNLDPADATVTEGADPINVTADVENTGDLSGTQNVTLEVTNASGEVVYSDTVSTELDAGNSTTVEFTGVQAGDLAPGDYTHAVASDDSSVEGNLTVEEAPDPANFGVSNLVPSGATVTEGDDPINVTADVENTGDLSGTQNVTLEVTNASGEVVYDEEESVEVDGGNTTTVEFTGVPAGDLTPGEYTHAVASEDSSVEGNLTVEAVDDGNGGNGDGSAPSDNPLFDESGEPMDGLDVTDALTTWTETGEINGEPVEGLDLIDYLSDWNEAQSGN